MFMNTEEPPFSDIPTLPDALITGALIVQQDQTGPCPTNPSSLHSSESLSWRDGGEGEARGWGGGLCLPLLRSPGRGRQRARGEA